MTDSESKWIRDQTEKTEDIKYLKKIKELDLIWSLNESISSFSSIEVFLEQVLIRALKVMDATSGSIMLIDPPGSNDLVIKAHYGLRKKVVDDTHQKVGQGIAGLVAERLEGMLLIDDLMDPRLRTRRKVTDALSVPIIDEKKLLVGVLNMNTKKKNPFDELDFMILNALTKTIANAIQRGRALEEIKSKIDEMQDLENEAKANLKTMIAELDKQRQRYQELHRAQEELKKAYKDLTGPFA